MVGHLYTRRHVSFTFHACRNTHTLYPLQQESSSDFIREIFFFVYYPIGWKIARNSLNPIRRFLGFDATHARNATHRITQHQTTTNRQPKDEHAKEDLSAAVRYTTNIERVAADWSDAEKDQEEKRKSVGMEEELRRVWMRASVAGFFFFFFSFSQLFVENYRSVPRKLVSGKERRLTEVMFKIQTKKRSRSYIYCCEFLRSFRPLRLYY